MTLKQTITQMLLRRPSGMMADHFNNRIKDYTWSEINEALGELLREEVIAVTSRRFWIRDSVKAMSLINVRDAG